MNGAAKGNCVIAGNIETTEDGTTQSHDHAILIVFKSPEALREAVRTGKCEFTVFGDPA